jgi:hypothetical protein
MPTVIPTDDSNACIFKIWQAIFFVFDIIGVGARLEC